MFVAVVAGILLSGCEPEDGIVDQETGSLVLGLTADSSGLFPDVAKYFRLRIYKGAPSSLAQSPFYSVPCGPLPRTEIAVSYLALRKDYAFVFEGYPDATCDSKTKLVAFGVRGEVEAAKKQACSDQDYYYLHVNQPGKFNAFPTPPADLNPSPGMGSIQCTKDADCQADKFVQPVEKCPEDASAGCAKKVIECTSNLQCLVDCTTQEKQANESYCVQGKKCAGWVFHPAATCGSDFICRLTSLYPLNARISRAFQFGTPDKHGAARVFGGAVKVDMPRLLTEYSTGVDKVTRADSEEFDPSTGLFSSQAMSNPINGHLFGTSVLVDNAQSLLLVGGATEVRLKSWEPAPNKKVLVPALNPDTCKTECSMTMSKQVSLVDLDSGSVSRGTMATGMALSPAALVTDSSGGQAVYLRSGLVTADKAIVLGTTAQICQLSGGAEVLKCAVAPGSEKGLTPRGAAASACLIEKAGICQEFLVLGGAINPEGAKFAELYTSKDGKVRELSGTADLPVGLWGAIAVRVSDKSVLTIGGTGTGDGVFAKPYLVEVDSAQGTVKATQAKVSGLKIEDLQRVYMQATWLGDGKTLLVTGGVSAEAKPLASALLLAIDASGTVKSSGTLTMGKARMGHTAVLVTGGVLRGTVLLAGGLTTLQGVPQFAEGAELFMPADWSF